MSDQESSGEVRFYTDLSAFHEGHPHIEVSGDELRIWPAGVGSVYLSTSVEHWRTLNAAVEAVIAAQATQDGAA